MKYISILLIFLYGCDESLPPKDIPQKLFEGKISPEYILTGQENVLRVRFILKNIFDETLEGKLLLDGMFEIQSNKNPDLKKSEKFNLSQLTYAKNYNPITNQLRLDPGDSITILYSWNFLSNDSIDLTKEFFNLQTDPACTIRMVAREETFRFNADIQIFKEISPAIFSQKEYSFCYTNIWVRQGSCPPIDCKK